MFSEQDEQDLNPEQEDADLNNSEEEEEEEDDEGEEEEERGSNTDEDTEDEEEEPELTPEERRQFRESLKKGDKRNNAKRRISKKNAINNSSDTEQRLSKIEESQRQAEELERKRAFGHENNLSPNQVDFVFKLTKRPTASFLKKAHVKAALDSISSQSNVLENTPSNSGRTFKGQGGKSWSKMDESEKQDNFADRRRSILASKK